MQFEMTEFLNPNDTEMLCIGSGTGVGAASGATVTGNEFVFCVKVIDGMAVELSISESKSKALEAAGLSE
jgi:hypothetical protein